jgi:hypothetical protein
MIATAPSTGRRYVADSVNLTDGGTLSMASPILLLSRFTNLDQEFASDRPNQLTGSTSGSGSDGPDVQRLPLGIPEDTTTLSSERTLPDPYQTPAATPATSLPAASYAPVRDEENTSPGSTRRITDNSQSPANSSAESTSSPVPKGPLQPEVAPRESKGSQDDSYQATSQTTQQSPLQLDRTLQQIGVDPQHTSLVRRVALVRLANDPSALGEYFDPPSAVSASYSSSPAQTNSSASDASASRLAPDTPEAPADAPHRSFVAQSKLLNVSA